VTVTEIDAEFHVVLLLFAAGFPPYPLLLILFFSGGEEVFSASRSPFRRGTLSALARRGMQSRCLLEHQTPPFPEVFLSPVENTSVGCTMRLFFCY